MKPESESTELNAVVLASAKSSFFMVGECATVFNLSKPGAVSHAHGFTSGVSAPSFAPGGFLQGLAEPLISKLHRGVTSLISGAGFFISISRYCPATPTGRDLFWVVT